jgi:hypothetical protein
MHDPIDVARIVQRLSPAKLESYIEYAEGVLAGTKPLPAQISYLRWPLSRIRWESSSGVSHPVSALTPRQRKQIISLFVEVARGKRGPCFIPQNILAATLGESAWPTTALRGNDAWRIFASHIANTLFMELSGQLGWSIVGYSEEDLDLLLNSRCFFRWSPQNQGYTLDGFEVGHVTPTDAGCLRRFVLNGGQPLFVYGSTGDTIASILEWCRHHLVHFMGAFESGNVNNIWGYRGFPPVPRMITQPLNDSAGCWGTTGFIKAVARILNIPVQLEILGWTTSAHATPYFTRQSRYLSHGDDVYNSLAFATPPYPASELLIDQDTYDSWYGYPDVPAEVCQRNIARQVGCELALKYLPDHLLKLYCDDVQANRAPASGNVMTHFSRWGYTYTDLLALDLWTRLQAKTSTFGGCSGIPSSYTPTERPQLPWCP